jgi:hypothetical protein
MMDGFERKILLRIIGPVNENVWWRRRYNKEFYFIYKEQMVTDIVRSVRLRRVGHIVRANDNEPPKNMQLVIREGKEEGAIQSSDG